MTKNDIFTLKKGINTLNDVFNENNKLQTMFDEMYLETKRDLLVWEKLTKELIEDREKFIRKDDRGNEIYLTSKDLGLEKKASKIDTNELEQELIKLDNNHKKLINNNELEQELIKFENNHKKLINNNDDVKTIKFKRG